MVDGRWTMDDGIWCEIFEKGDMTKQQERRLSSSKASCHGKRSRMLQTDKDHQKGQPTAAAAATTRRDDHSPFLERLEYILMLQKQRH
jgi:hypothetical protein